MSLAERISVINRGFFAANSPADEMKQILPDGTQEVVNWTTVRPALLELDAMSWCQLQEEWRYFLDENRYPIGTTLELTPDRANIFRSITQQLHRQISEPMRVLTSVHPAISEHDVTVTVDSKDLETIEAAVRHVHAVTNLAAIDDAITVASLQPGSLEIVLTAGRVTLLGLGLAITLAKTLKTSRVKDNAQLLMRLLNKRNPDEDISDEEALDTAQEQAKDEFWDLSFPQLQAKFTEAGKDHQVNEAKNRIEQAAKEIVANADKVSVNWKLPAAVIHGLPGGATAHINLDDPEAIGRVIRAIAAPPD